MEYNNYYPSQSGHPPPPNQQHGGLGNNNGGPQLTPQQQQQNHQMMHSPMHQQQNRQTMPPGPSNHHQHQQIQQHQHMQHQGYQQIHSPHGPPVSHSNSPHAPQQQQHPTQHQHHNHQPNMTGPLPQQAMGPQHIHHSQSPHHLSPMPPHIALQQPLNHMARLQMGSAVINHHHPGMNQPPVHPQQNFFGGPMPQANLHYHQQNQHQHSQNQSAHHHHHIHHQHQPQIMHHGPPPPIMGHFPHHIQQGVGRSSPYLSHILQSEFRIIEFNRRLQCRPVRYPSNPMPSHLDEHSLWWDRFASEFFLDDATLTLRLILEEKPVEYTIGRTLIPRFFRTYFDGGVTDLSINLRNPRESYIHPHLITLDCDQAFVVTNNSFKFTGLPNNHGIVVHTEGHLIIDFVSNNFDSLSIKSWRFYTKRSHEYIDRNILATLGLPNNYLAEPITKQGLTKSTISYLKMCMIMEPMQELMYQHKQTKMDPRSCLRKLLFDRYKFRSGEDTRTATNKRRKRKTSAATTTGTTTTSNKKSKTAMGNNTGINNNMMMSPTTAQPVFSLATQDVMVVGEPSMMGGDFGDDNERMITRLENTQYDSSATTQLNDQVMNPSSGNDASINVSVHMKSSQNHTMSPPLIDQTSHQVSVQDPLLADPVSESIALESALQHLPTPQVSEKHQEEQIQTPIAQSKVHEDDLSVVSHAPHQDDLHPTPATNSHPVPEPHNHSGDLIDDSVTSNPATTIQSSLPQDNPVDQQQDIVHPSDQLSNSETVKLELHTMDQSEAPKTSTDETQAQVTTIDSKQELTDQDECLGPADENHVQNHEAEVKNVKITLMSESTDDSQIIMGMNSTEPSDNHTNSIQNLTDESNSNSQLACSTADNRSTTMEQQQPVDNGVA